MIRTLLYDEAQQALTQGGAEQIALWKNNPRLFVWVDLLDEAPDVEGEMMECDFGIHPLAISDAQRTRHPAKIEAFPDHTFILLKGLSIDTSTIDFETIQIALFVGQRFLLTRHSGPSLSIDKLWAETVAGQNQELIIHHQADALAVRLTRFVVDRYLPILLELEDRLELIEEEMLADPKDALLFELIEYKTQLKKLRRIMAYHTQVFGQLKSTTWPAIEHEHIHEINDVYEHLERATSLTSLYHELISDLQDGYISLASHRLNNIVKVLTIITVIFIPLGFLAGVYGMNFDHIPELHFKYAYYVLLSVMVIIVVSLLVLFKKIKWL